VSSPLSSRAGDTPPRERTASSILELDSGAPSGVLLNGTHRVTPWCAAGAVAYVPQRRRQVHLDAFADEVRVPTGSLLHGSAQPCPKPDGVHGAVVGLDLRLREPRSGLVALVVVPEQPLGWFVCGARKLPHARGWFSAVDQDTVDGVEFSPVARARAIATVLFDGVLAALRAAHEVVRVDAMLLPLGNQIAQVVYERTLGGVVVAAWYLSHAGNIATLWQRHKSAPTHP
jgi:hypothetical protein